MTRSREQINAFRVAETQAKRATRIEHRLEQMHSELVAARHRIEALERQLRAECMETERVLGQADSFEAAFDAAREQLRLAEEGWRLEAHLRRELEAKPLWRIAAKRLRAWMERTCR